ncbi:hypothetical protein SNEBB_001875 [Seison nebaliae]|nr:hypothetical protein SNEBB_001875 [Seison nebaliae]
MSKEENESTEIYSDTLDRDCLDDDDDDDDDYECELEDEPSSIQNEIPEGNSMTFKKAFFKKIFALNISSFPTGNGPWRNEKLIGTVEERFQARYLDDDVNDNPNKFSVEELHDFANDPLSPWAKDYSWSPEVKSLAKILETKTVLMPTQSQLSHIYKSDTSMYDDLSIMKIFKKFLLEFRTIYLRESNIGVIDPYCKNLINLRKLVLSVNSIRKVNGNNLPGNLEFLELLGNSISSLRDVHSLPPSMKYLGVAHNLIPSIETITVLRNLQAIDLSFNDLSDIERTVKNLSLIPELTVLYLMGNPISLLPWYKIYIIDSITTLAVLDGDNIYVDGRVNANGTRGKLEESKKDLELCIFAVWIKSIENLGMMRPGENAADLHYAIEIDVPRGESDMNMNGKMETHILTLTLPQQRINYALKNQICNLRATNDQETIYQAIMNRQDKEIQAKKSTISAKQQYQRNFQNSTPLKNLMMKSYFDKGIEEKQELRIKEKPTKQAIEFDNRSDGLFIIKRTNLRRMVHFLKGNLKFKIKHLYDETRTLQTKEDIPRMGKVITEFNVNLRHIFESSRHRVDFQHQFNYPQSAPPTPKSEKFLMEKEPSAIPLSRHGGVVNISGQILVLEMNKTVGIADLMSVCKIISRLHFFVLDLLLILDCVWRHFLLLHFHINRLT